MTFRSIVFALAAAAAALLPVAAVAAPILVEAAPSVRVSYADLNLAAAAGRQALDSRIARAAKEVCGRPLKSELMLMAAARQCREEAVSSANRQLEKVLSPRFAAAPSSIEVSGTH